MALPDAVRRLPFDLPRIAEVVGSARVIAIGESSHYIGEFGALRDRVLRFLVTELGFGVVAMESGFAEGHQVDAWIRGGAGDLQDVVRDGFTFRAGDPVEVHEILRWLRAWNAGGGQVVFAGLDVPGSGGSPLPALRQVRDHLAAHAPEHLSLVDAAVEATALYAAANNGAAPVRYARLSAAQRDAATAALARLLLALDALPREPDPLGLAVARHNALGGLRLDEQLRELTALTGAAPPASAVSSRDVYQAETVRLLRMLHGAGKRIVLLLHNAHAQRVPLALLPGVHARSVGSYLADDLGPEYVAIGVTARGGTVADVRLDEGGRHGIAVVPRQLEPPAAGSVEHAVAAEAAGKDAVLLDLRPARGGPGPTSIRYVAGYAAVDVVAAFDALVCLPTMTPSTSTAGP
jgi:erythromycin esterase